MPTTVPAVEVAQYVLEVEFSKLAAPPFDPHATHDLPILAAAIARYKQSPAASPHHFYAALLDERLVWERQDVPAAQVIRGPGEGGVETACAEKARGFAEAFVQLAMALPVEQRAPLAEFYRERPMRFPVVPTVLVDYTAATPWLSGAKPAGLLVYRLLDGYHRSFALIRQGARTLDTLVARMVDGGPWPGYYGHLDRAAGPPWRLATPPAAR